MNLTLAEFGSRSYLISVPGLELIPSEISRADFAFRLALRAIRQVFFAKMRCVTVTLGNRT